MQTRKNSGTVTKTGINDWLDSIDLESPITLGSDKLEKAYFEAAAVLTSFEPESVKPVDWAHASADPMTAYLGGDEDEYEQGGTEYMQRLSDAVEPVIYNDQNSRWSMLPTYRRDVLTQMGSREAIKKRY